MHYYLEMTTKPGSVDGLILQIREEVSNKTDAIAKIEDYRDDFDGYGWTAVCHTCNHSINNAPCTFEILEINSGITVGDTDNFLHIEEQNYDTINKVPTFVKVLATNKGDATSKYNSKYKTKFNGKIHTKKYKVFQNKKQASSEDI